MLLGDTMRYTCLFFKKTDASLVVTMGAGDGGDYYLNPWGKINEEKPLQEKRRYGGRTTSARPLGEGRLDDFLITPLAVSCARRVDKATALATSPGSLIAPDESRPTPGAEQSIRFRDRLALGTFTDAEFRSTLSTEYCTCVVECAAHRALHHRSPWNGLRRLRVSLAPPACPISPG